MDFIKKLLLAKQEITQKQLRLKLRTTLFVSIAAVIFFSSLIAIVYFLGFNVFRDKAIESQGEMARTLASAVDSTIEKQAELLKLNANTQLIIDALKENNLKYRTKSEKETQRYLMDVDKRWIEASDDHPFLKDYLGNKLSLGLKALKGEDEKIVSLIVTDKFGGLAGSTTRPSGFYSFDKDWWLNSYAKGRGKIFIGGVEYDEESNLWCLPFAVPIEDETGTVIGIAKASISIDTFFQPLLNFRIGKTGNAVLADDKAYLVYHQKAAPFANKFCEYEEFQKTLQNSDKWGILGSAYLNHGKTLAAYSEVVSAKGVNWFVFVERDLREIFAPLNKLILVMVLIGIALTIILALSVFILSAQESPGSILQVIKETPLVKTEDEKSNRIEGRAKRLPRDK
ncbi:MAG: cache domain-containing protein [Candidatus Omnitrophica bacterium]|nr:cache domain-containing protein [Candidatus Omnitrophota bacterium]